MDKIELNIKIFFPVILGVLSIIGMLLLIFSGDLECVEQIFKSVYTFPLINFGIIVASIWLYILSMVKGGESGDTTSLFSLSLLALSNLSFVNDLMEMADDINVNQIITFFMYSLVIASYIFMAYFIYLTLKRKNKIHNKKAK
ncbi:hypothetical protein [Providencia sp. PROV148]|uniref:hypothetical protein n=1 Tax=Providencia sp. PROV148 TaxID=2949858 RepID=UPI00234AD8A7|nr:hypothetical protein [Providencia sp. PROV148]